MGHRTTPGRGRKRAPGLDDDPAPRPVDDDAFKITASPSALANAERECLKTKARLARAATESEREQADLIRAENERLASECRALREERDRAWADRDHLRDTLARRDASLERLARECEGWRARAKSLERGAREMLRDMDREVHHAPRAHDPIEASRAPRGAPRGVESRNPPVPGRGRAATP